MTPEGKVKAKVKKILKKYPHWGDWPVPSGYGKGTLDYIGCIAGRFFAVEVKAEGNKPTALQDRTITEMRWHGAEVFVIAGVNDLELVNLDHWLCALWMEDK
jgi:hypothetical protein